MFTREKYQIVFKFILGMIVVLCVSAASVLPAEAHFLLVDQNIGAVLHIDPNDDPLANAPAKFNFDFKDTTGKLDLNLCDCTFSILTNGSPIYSGKLGTDPTIQFTKTTVMFSFTLPTKGIYTIIVEGKPGATGNFQSFKLNYDLRVDKESAGTAPAPSALVRFLGGHAIHIVLFGGAILISLYIVIRDKNRQKKV